MPRNLVPVATLFAAAFLFLFGSAHAADGEVVPFKKNKNLYAGNTAIGTSPSGRTFQIFYVKDGKVTYNDSKGLSQSGKWVITNDGMLCYDWRHWRDRCYSHKIDGDEYQSYCDGKTKGSRFKLAPGKAGLKK